MASMSTPYYLVHAGDRMFMVIGLGATIYGQNLPSVKEQVALRICLVAGVMQPVALVL